MFEPGSVLIDRYEILSLLGEGGMGLVYLCRNRATGRNLALKILAEELQTDPRRTARFKREYEILKKISHPAVVTVHDLHELESGEVFFTMEAIEGKPLVHEPNIGRALRTLRKIAEGLKAIHSAGFLYCDLKPSNTLVVAGADGEPETKLVDFGISQAIVAWADAEAAAMVGTSLYMSPEQVRGEKLDPRSDIYSFGVLAFEFLTGRLPFESDSTFNIAAAHLLAEIPSARKFNRNIPGPVDRMIRICLEKDRKDRYGSVDEIISRLDAAAASRSRPGFFARLFGGGSS